MPSFLPPLLSVLLKPWPTFFLSFALLSPSSGKAVIFSIWNPEPCYPSSSTIIKEKESFDQPYNPGTKTERIKPVPIHPGWRRGLGVYWSFRLREKLMRAFGLWPTWTSFKEGEKKGLDQILETVFSFLAFVSREHCTAFCWLSRKARVCINARTVVLDSGWGRYFCLCVSPGSSSEYRFTPAVPIHLGWRYSN